MKKQIQYFLVIFLFSHLACFASDGNRTYPLSSLKGSDLYKKQAPYRQKLFALKKFQKMIHQKEEAKQSIEKARQILSGNAVLYCACAWYVHRQSKNSQLNQPLQKKSVKVMSRSARMFFNLFKRNPQGG